MGRTFVRQDAQVASTLHTVVGFLDDKAPSLANYQTNATDLAYDLNALRSVAQDILNRDGASMPTGKWYDGIVAPTTFEGGIKRGVTKLNQELHDLERKRVLVSVAGLVDVTVSAGQNFEILALGELPADTIAAVGAVTTRGTVAAFHAGTFGDHSLDEVGGSTAISPKNLCEVVDGATRDPILSSGRVVYALFQTETATDGHTMTGTTPMRAQLSFVRINAAGNDLEAVPFADIENKVINYASVKRVALEDLTEQDFLRGAITDVPSGATVTRQVAYDNQGTTPVDLTTNAILDIETTGAFWQLRDEAEASLLKVTTNTGTSATTLQVGADVDYFDVNSVDNDFLAGIKARTGGTRPINIGVSDGIIASTAGALELQATTTLSFDDGNKPVGWSLADGMHLSDAGAEWTAFENYFGEVSLLNAINQSYMKQKRTKTQAVLTADVAANTDVNGPTYDNNTDVDLPPYSLVPTSFVADVEVYLNGELLRNNAVAGAQDVYPGTTPSTGDLMFTFGLKGTGAKPDQLTVIVNGQ